METERPDRVALARAILDLLAGEGKPVSRATLVRRVAGEADPRVDPATVLQVLLKLERAGLVERSSRGYALAPGTRWPGDGEKDLATFFATELEVGDGGPEGAMLAAPPRRFLRLPAHIADDPRIVPVWYATNRAPENTAREAEGYSGEREVRGLHHGYCLVDVPRRYTRGGSGRGWLRRLIAREATTLRLAGISPRSEVDFWGEFGATLAAQAGPEALLLFVHGYRTTFRRAAEGAAQLGYELDVPVAMFSWPSQGRLLGYAADEAAIDASIEAFEPFLREMAAFAARQGRRLHLIAHSMGNRLLLRALERIARAGDSPAIEQVIFAAPDEDAERFRQLFAACARLGRGHTLYASKHDLPVRISRGLHRAPRAGFIPPPTVVPPAHTVDISGYDITYTDHGYCFDLAPVLEDMSAVLSGGARRLRNPGTGPHHWILR